MHHTLVCLKIITSEIVLQRSGRISTQGRVHNTRTKDDIQTRQLIWFGI